MTRTIDTELLERLKTLRSRAYAPYSDHPVAVIVEAASGERFGGTNVEVAHFKSQCAEASAISAMIGAGDHDIKQVWILGPRAIPCAPCGDCRQRLREFGDDATLVYAVDDSGNILLERTLSQLLPDSFGPDNLSD